MIGDATVESVRPPQSALRVASNAQPSQQYTFPPRRIANSSIESPQ
jgi:hypothetical protein